LNPKFSELYNEYHKPLARADQTQEP